MRLALRVPFLVISVILVSAPLRAQLGATVPNWAVPTTTLGPSRSGRMHTMGDITTPAPFIGVTPCRIVDTRLANGPFGGPAISPGSPRSFNLLNGPCAGIPAPSVNTLTFSLNVTAVNPSGIGFLKVFPKGGSSPVVSTLNFVAGETIANAVIVAGGTLSGGITVAAAATTDVLIDINGYFANDLNDDEQFRVSGNASFPLVSFFNAGFGAGFVAEAAKSDGVVGLTDSSAGDKAGVLGTDGSGGVIESPPRLSAGVRGESAQHVGVLGLSENIGISGELFSFGAVVARGFLGSTIGMGAGSTSGPWGVFAAGDFGASGAKHFVEPHPSDPNKVIVYTSIEGRTADTYFRGTARTVDGRAVIEVPEDFRIVTDEEGLTVQLTPVGPLTVMSVESQGLDQIAVRSSNDVAFHYLVQGVRRAFKDLRPVQTGYEFMPESADQTMPAYLTDEAKRRLIANGTYNADGTVNRTTAERVGWTKIWADRAAAAQEAAERSAAGPAEPVRRAPPAQ